MPRWPSSTRGVNHIDTAASYGESELRLAPFLGEHRDRSSWPPRPATDRRGARAELERWLERMGVDQVDLIQLHNLVEPDEWETAHGPGGAVEALAAARDEGLCRTSASPATAPGSAACTSAAWNASPSQRAVPVNFVMLETRPTAPMSRR